MPPVLRKGHPATTDPPRDHVKPDRQPIHNLDAVNATYLTLLEHPFAGACRGSGSGLISIVSRYPMYVCTSRWLPYVCLHKSLFPKIVDVRHHATVPLRRIHRDQPNAYRFDFAWRDADPITPGCSESEDTPPREADIILQDRCLPVPPRVHFLKHPAATASPV